MSKNKNKLLNNISDIFRIIRSRYRVIVRKLRRSLLHPMLFNGGRYSRAGFVLPTVTMVMLVVVLLSIAILLRSFDRADVARNVKVNQQVLSAATPALERAKAKINYLLNSDPSLPRGTPTDKVLYDALSNNNYTFGDEDRLQVEFDLNGGGIDADGANTGIIEDDEAIQTAWRFEVDTNNDNQLDSYTLYSIVFRSPTRDSETGEFDRARSPLDAKTPPMPPLTASAGDCRIIGGSASLVGDSGWYSSAGSLKKSFFVYVATMPISPQGSSGYSALEYQQDVTRRPLLNNAVIYEDDLEIGSAPPLRLNGRIMTNSNLLVTRFDPGPVQFYLVSSPDSCFYEEDNSKIIVGGNVLNGWSGANSARNAVQVHLYRDDATAPFTPTVREIGANGTNQTVSNNPLEGYYNNDAYSQRISYLVDKGNDITDTTQRPTEVNTAINSGTPEDEAWEAYFRQRTRKVPFAEVGNGAVALTGTESLQGTGDTIRPPDNWIYPTTISNNGAVSATGGPTNLTIQPSNLPATDPDLLETQNNPEELQIGDRILAGNNLPAKWWKNNKFVDKTETQEVTGGQWRDLNGQPITTTTRTRQTRVNLLADVGVTDRDGFWEEAAAQVPIAALDGIGGMRVVTGAGVYERVNSFLPPPRWDNPTTPAVEASLTYDDPETTDTEAYEIVWPDTMPMSLPDNASRVYDNETNQWIDIDIDKNSLPAAVTNSIDTSTKKYAKGDLRMRATAVYHYAADGFIEGEAVTQEPIACISSYYDPTNSTTAQNIQGLGDAGFGEDTAGESNNGIVYGPPSTARPAATLLTTTGTSLAGILAKEANMVFPNGRFVNEKLRDALPKADNERSLSEKAAIDTTMCALGILGSSTVSLDTAPAIPNVAIREAALLDAREIKAIDADAPATRVDETFTLSSPLSPDAQAANLTGNYDLALEERQPQEIRVTQLDINQLRNQTIAYSESPVIGELNPEYLLPYSGIIYASRDDALRDRSNRSATQTQSKLQSSTDLRLDPTRRPNGIMLINGQYLARNDANNDGQNDAANPSTQDIVKEKGMTLVSNLPVYVQGVFNDHNREEFTNLVTNNWGNFYARAEDDIDDNFACHAGDPRIEDCTQGDTWRPVNILADAITLLSNNFRLGFRDEGDFDLRNNAGNGAIVGYDFDGNGQISASNPLVSEATYNGLNLNGVDSDADGTLTNDTGVKETEVTAKAARLLNGFFANNFVTNGFSSGGFDVNSALKADLNAASPAPLNDAFYIGAPANNQVGNSSYFNNLVTPVQRRGVFPEYLMEICRKLPVSACGPKDWVVGYDIAGNGNEFTDTVLGKPEANLTARDLAVNIPTATLNVYTLGSFNPTLLLAGTTHLPAKNPADRLFPRRVAFLRSDTGNLILDSNILPIPLGIANGAAGDTSSANSAGILECYRSPGSSAISAGSHTCPAYATGTRPRLRSNALWFQTRNNIARNWGYDYPLWYLDPNNPNTSATYTATTRQPLLVPVLQIQAVKTQPAANILPANYIGNVWSNGANATARSQNSKWLPLAQNTEFNMVMAVGDTPSRNVNGTDGETNGGMQNLPRALENWDLQGTPNEQVITVKGSFIQLKRTSFATAPYQSVLLPDPNITSGAVGLFNYIQMYNNNVAQAGAVGGRASYFRPFGRNWGFDVGLLSQAPDLFAQTFTLPEDDVDPDEYYREVGRDDPWITGLLCSKLLNASGATAGNAIDRPQSLDCSDYGG